MTGLYPVSFDFALLNLTEFTTLHNSMSEKCTKMNKKIWKQLENVLSETFSVFRIIKNNSVYKFWLSIPRMESEHNTSTLWESTTVEAKKEVKNKEICKNQKTLENQWPQKRGILTTRQKISPEHIKNWKSKISLSSCKDRKSDKRTSNEIKINKLTWPLHYKT